MPNPKTGPVSGAYQASWAGDAIGNVQLGGFKLRYSYDERRITYDSVGTAPVDTLFTGLNMSIDFICMEPNLDEVQAMAWPFAAAEGQVNAAGFSLWDAAKPFILTPCSAATDPSVLTFPKTIIAPGFEVSQDFSGVMERTIPMRLIVFPVAYEASEPNYAEGSQQRPIACAPTIYFLRTDLA